MSNDKKDLRERDPELVGKPITLEELRRMLVTGLNVTSVRNLREGKVEEATASMDWLDDVTPEELSTAGKLDLGKMAKKAGTLRFTPVYEATDPTKVVDARVDFGAHRGELLTEIYKKDGSYLIWLRDKSFASKDLKEIVEYVISSRAGAKRRRHEPPGPSKWEAAGLSPKKEMRATSVSAFDFRSKEVRFKAGTEIIAGVDFAFGIDKTIATMTKGEHIVYSREYMGTPPEYTEAEKAEMEAETRAQEADSYEEFRRIRGH